MTESKKKMFIFQQSNKQGANLMVKKDFFYEKLQKEQKLWTFSIFVNLQKKSRTIIVKYLSASSL